VFFDKVAKELIGKGALTLIRSKAPAGASVEDAIQAARADQSVPREITSIVSRKYRLVVSVTTRSFDPESGDPSYQVHRIELLHGNQPRPTGLGRGRGLTLASSSQSVDSGRPNADGDALAAAAILHQDGPSSNVTATSDVPDSCSILVSTVSVCKLQLLTYRIV
jgi:hypothetical protein